MILFSSFDDSKFFTFISFCENNTVYHPLIDTYFFYVKINVKKDFNFNFLHFQNIFSESIYCTVLLFTKHNLNAINLNSLQKISTTK